MSHVADAERRYHEDGEFRAFVDEIVKAARRREFASPYLIALAATAATVCVLEADNSDPPREGAD